MALDTLLPGSQRRFALAAALRGVAGVIRAAPRLARCAAVAAVWLAAGFAGQAWAGPPPGTIISNTAFMTYTSTVADPGDAALGKPPYPAGTRINIPSNTVEVIILRVSAFTLTSSQARFSAPNTTVYFYHTLTNTGNAADTFDLSAISPGASCATCAAWVFPVALYADMTPADGLPDNNTAITSTGSLAPGQTFTFVAAGTVPVAAVSGDDKAINVRAAGNAAAAAAGAYTAAVAQTNTDTVRVTSAAVLSPAGKRFSASTGPSPSAANVTASITYSNNTAVAATSVRITDWIGISTSSPVVLNTTGFRYVAGSARWSSCTGALTDAVDGNECGPAAERMNFSVTYPNAPSTASARIDALIESVPAHTSGTLTFELEVIGGLASGVALTTNAAQLAYCDGAAGVCNNRTINTNQATYDVTTGITDVDLRVAKTITKPSTGGNFISRTLLASQPASARRVLDFSGS